MNFPITKERLHQLNKEHIQSEVTNYIKEVADYMSQSIINRAINTSKPCYSGADITKLRQLVFKFRDVLGQSRRFLEEPKESYIPQILAELRTRFPDSTITVDPLNTYVIVDWS